MNLNDLIFPYDYILLVILILTFTICSIKGFINSLLGLLTWVGAILITIYSYLSISDFLTKQIMKINFFESYGYLTNIFFIIITIPLIFLISLFILKRIRGLLISDINNNILGIILDKIFGFIYGLVFFYIILTTGIIFIDKFNLDFFNEWLNNNTMIIQNINNFNNEYIYLLDQNENTQ